jgi:hypothetical protein
MSAGFPDYYDILHCDPSSTEAQIRTAYKVRLQESDEAMTVKTHFDHSNPLETIAVDASR